jgi:uncharacterized membrane protein YeaQ/YmgE (transglycosylase-associated protein family)
MLWTIIVTLVGGTIIGLLGKAVAPGDRDNIPLWLVVICGIVGAFVGSYAYAAVWNCDDMNNCTDGVDWWRHLWQIGAAAILVVGAASTTGRKKV